MKKIVASLAIALLATSAMADEAAKGGMSFTQLDADRDGKVTSTEAAGSAELSSAFKTSDANGDGALSKSEYDAWLTTQPSSGEDRAPAADKPNPGT